MKIAIFLGILSVSSSAFALDGYVENTVGQIWRDAGGACWHTASWTPAKIVPGCDGMPLNKRVPAPIATVPDSDADGVPDNLDKCPGTPEGALVDAVGCPKKLEREVQMNLDVTFATGKADIVGDASKEIRKVSKFMKQYPTIKVRIEGFTDNVGTPADNQKLSERRAEAVKEQLIADGVKTDRLTSIGFGQSKPVADNNTDAGRAQNRRVIAHAQAERETLELKK
ncbi:MAG TPA: OmpA family protein [Polyangiaceae bacterium]|jgi:OOP family OmpA-OmpF porin